MKICIDLDGVIVKEDEKLTPPERYEYAELIEGAKKFLDWMNEKDFLVVIYSSRWEKDRDITEKWLKRHGIRYDSLVLGKPRADYYIDDRALRFVGRFKLIKEFIEVDLA